MAARSMSYGVGVVLRLCGAGDGVEDAAGGALASGEVGIEDRILLVLGESQLGAEVADGPASVLDAGVGGGLRSRRLRVRWSVMRNVAVASATCSAMRSTAARWVLGDVDPKVGARERGDAARQS